MHNIKSHEIKLAYALTGKNSVRNSLRYIEITSTQLIATDSYKVIFVDRDEPNTNTTAPKEYLAPNVAEAVSKATNKKNAKDNHANLPIETILDESFADGPYPNCKQVVDEWKGRPNSINPEGDFFSVEQLAELFTALHQHSKLVTNKNTAPKIKLRVAQNGYAHALIFSAPNINGILMGCSNT